MMAERQRREAARIADQLMNEIDDDSPPEEEEDMININQVHRSQNEVSSSSDDDQEPQRESLQHRQLLRDKDGNEWFQAPPLQRRRDIANIFRETAGPTRNSRKDTVLKTWELFLPMESLNDIVRHSQEHADRLGISVRLTVESLMAYFGVLYYRGANHDCKIPVSELFSTNYSMFYRTAISRPLFNIWTRCLTFDDKSTREERKRADKFAAIREFYGKWNNNLRAYFVPGVNITIDEQLISSRCRSPNKVYNPMKPGKFGELVRWCVDSDYRYFLNSDPLTKRPDNEHAAAEHKINNTAKQLVLNLAGPFLDKGRNITADRFFTSKAIAEELLQRRTTYVGTIARNKREIPPMLHSKMTPGESKFVFGGTDKKLTLQSSQVKRNRKVYLLSSMHHDLPTSIESTSGKSDIQLFYNSTKAGVDVLDEMCKGFSTRSRVLRWPLVHLHNILDVTAINTHTIYRIHHPSTNSIGQNPRTARRSFLLQLATELVQDHVKSRLNDPVGMSTELVANLSRLSRQTNPRLAIQQDVTSGQRVRCLTCIQDGRNSRDCNKTSSKCRVCGIPVCGKHSEKAILCRDC